MQTLKIAPCNISCENESVIGLFLLEEKKNTLHAVFKMCMFVVLSCITMGLQAQLDSTYWYENGLPEWWYYQKDVFAFRCQGGTDYFGTFDSAVVNFKLYHGDRREKAVEVYFKPTSTPMQRIQTIVDIYNSGQFEVGYPTITETPFAVALQKKWYLIDDLVLVKFVDPHEDSTDIAAFMDRYMLTMHYKPSPDLPYQGNYTYVFKMPTSVKDDYISMVSVMYENEIGFVEQVTPNFVNYATSNEEANYPSINDTTFTMPSYTQASCTNLNDPYFIYTNMSNPNPALKNQSWHIDNPGSFSHVTNFGTGVATAGADAQICECWDMGLDGSGIAIAVIGDGLFCSSHPDIGQAQIIDAWDCSSNGSCFQFDHTVPTNPQNNTKGLQNLTSVLVSKHNNNNGTVGICPQSKVLVLKTSNFEGTTSTASFIKAIHMAYKVDYYIDISLTNIVSDIDIQAIEDEINNLINYGRTKYLSGTAIQLGQTFIASTGGNPNLVAGQSPGTTQNKYPAAYENVIGVIGSTPNDLKKGHNDGWGIVGINDESVNYGAQYDVAAPSSYIAANTYQPNVAGGYFYQTNASDKSFNISPAVVGGIIALLLDHNYYLTSDDIENILHTYSDKVTYNYINGLSTEFAYGRVNCENYVQNTVNIKEEKITQLKSYFHDGYVWVEFPKNVVGEFVTCVLIDVNGRQVWGTNSSIETSPMQYTLPSLPTGIYFLSISTSTQIYTSTLISYE